MVKYTHFWVLKSPIFASEAKQLKKKHVEQYIRSEQLLKWQQSSTLIIEKTEKISLLLTKSLLSLIRDIYTYI